MGDPGLHSKFIEMQQDERFASGIEIGERLITAQERGAMMDITRITRLLVSARTPEQRQSLNAALDDARRRYWGALRK